jgi:hypothetical protein
MAVQAGNVKILYKQNIKYGSNNGINLGDSALPKVNDTPVHTAFKAAGKIIESGADLIAAPVVWLKDMQKNWLTYMIIVAIILLSIAFLYCVIRSYFGRKQNNWSVGNLIELASMFTNKTAALQTQLPLSTPKLPSAGLTPNASFNV